MSKEIIINSSTTETRIALLEDGHLAELFVERPENERNVGDIYKGRVRKVLVGMSAAFVDIGWNQDAFLHFNDAGELYSPDEEVETDSQTGKGQARQINLQTNQEIFVQISKEPIGNKGPRVSGEVALPGRFVVLVPYSTSVGVSRKIHDSREKRRLKTIARHLKPAGCGLIVRTVAVDRDEATLSEDIDNLYALWRKIEEKARWVNAPAMVYKEISLSSSVIRDLFNPEIDMLVVDKRNLYREITAYVDSVAPQLVDRIHLYRESVPIFDKYQIEPEIEQGIRRKVWIEGGGHIIIEHTEAMVTIDVNSGRFIGKQNHEENSLKVNLSAAREICRQLRLRDIGGIIVIDFIDLLEEKNRKKVYDEVMKELKKDRAKVDVAPIGHFGLMMMTRQRIKPSLLFTFKESCSVCHGTGMIASKETIVTELERWLARFRNRAGEMRVRVHVHPDLYVFLTEGGVLNRIRRIMLHQRLFIRLLADSSIPPNEFRAFSIRNKTDITEEYRA